MKVICKTCERELEEEDFYHFKRTKTGKGYLFPDCKECTIKKRKEWRQTKIQRPKGYTERQERAEVKKKRIDDVNNEALKNGMSYGKYVAMKYARGERV